MADSKMADLISLKRGELQAHQLSEATQAAAMMHLGNCQMGAKVLKMLHDAGVAFDDDVPYPPKSLVVQKELEDLGADPNTAGESIDAKEPVQEPVIKGEILCAFSVKDL